MGALEWWRRRRRAGVHPFDRATGMDTSGLIAREGSPYYGTAPSLFHAVMERWGGEAAAYTFVDLGCGKGRVVLLASEMGFPECVGVELNPELVAVARQNVARWRRAAGPVRIVEGDATEFDFPPGRSVVYLFHPFQAEVLERLLGRIAAAFAHRSGELDLLYVNAEFDGLLRERAGWMLLWEMPVRMSREDAAADLLYGEGYGEAGCSGWRWVGTPGAPGLSSLRLGDHGAPG